MAFERAYPGFRAPQGFPSLPAGWHTEPINSLSADGRMKLFGVLHRRTHGPVKRLLAILHGYGEHGGRYLHFPHYLESKFDGVFVLDHRGHGRSEGQRGHCEAFDSLIEDFIRALEELLFKLSGEGTVPEVHVLGHSLGGLLALRMAFLHPEIEVQAYHISAPFLALKSSVHPIKRWAATGLAKIWGTLSMGADFDPSVLSQDPNVVKHYLSDRLNHSRMTPSMYVALAAAQKDTLARFHESTRPIQLLLPMADPLVDSGVSRRFFSGLQAPRSRLVELEGFRHEPMNEIGKERFFDALLGFVET